MFQADWTFSHQLTVTGGLSVSGDAYYDGTEIVNKTILATELLKYSKTGHTHTKSDITDLNLSDYSKTGHTHDYAPNGHTHKVTINGTTYTVS